MGNYMKRHGKLHENGMEMANDMPWLGKAWKWHGNGMTWQWHVMAWKWQ
jgi:hypothetical protein